MPDGSDARPPTLIGEHVDQALARSRMTRADLARGLGVNASTVTRLIRGEITMTVPTLVQIAERVGYDPCQLIKGTFDTDPCTGGQ